MKKTNFTVMFPVWAMLALAAPPAPAIQPNDGNAQTADDQKNNKDDVALTAKVRKAIMDDKTLSVTAKNVKIIAQNGMITLKGEVKTEEEKNTIASRARDIAGANQVSDLITVNPK